ncbi:voltage-dependent calcium channel alpha 1, invertebrate [Trypanosoma grayi]|uniref:voltage-dependent calcium channel alpha 1, invertebrate n=1 Tax=Trypanosoma grayi TaxID=71804 RepID=UPI0004F4B106|nr:voltage-dependent calcium channel alpha 1, invertebrate [Trypanosoma grayi]KEG12782.1 voltage-dependent calcium channel alpha 1, invertebrate [Trypanosoma grayi]
MPYAQGTVSWDGVLKNWTPGPWHVYPERGSSLFLFSHRGRFRLLCYKLVAHPRMFIVWSSAVAASTALTAAFQPAYDFGRTASLVLNTMQAVLLVFFWLRCILEIIAVGLVLHPGAFFRSFWNVVELVVNAMGVVALLQPTGHHRWMRAFAVARPLRFLLRVPGFLPVILTIVREARLLGEVLVFFVLLLASLALMGVMLVRDGLDHHCYITATSPTGPYPSLEVPFRLRNVSAVCGARFRCPSVAGATVECLPERLSYGDKFMTYDNIGSAMLLMFKVGTTDSWYENAEDIMNARGEASVLLLVCMIIVSFFSLCLLLAIVHESYTQTSSSVRDLKSTTSVDEELALIGKDESKDAAVQAPEEEPILILPNVTRESNGPDQTIPLALYDSFDMVRATLGGFHVSRFVPYPGPPPVTNFLKACSVSGLLQALCDQERSLYGPILRGRLSKKIVLAVDNSVVCLLIICVSLANLLLLVVTWEGMDNVLRGRLMTASAACSLAYVIPVTMKCVSFGPAATIRDVWNVFDALAAISGFLELIAPRLFSIHVVRGLRTLRVLRLGKYVPSLRRFKKYYIRDHGYAVLLIVVTLVLYAVVGMQLFGDSYRLDGWLRGSFGTFWEALLTCFVVFTGDNWTLCMRGTLETGTPVTGVIFFLSLYVMSVLEVSLFISIMITRFVTVWSACERCEGIEVPPLLVLPGYDIARYPQPNSIELTIEKKSRSGFLDENSKLRSSVFQKIERWLAWLLSTRTLRVKGASFFLFDPQCSLRRLLLSILGSMWYRILVMLCVTMGVVSLLFERHDNTPQLEYKLRVVHIVYTAFFLGEMVMKWIAFGVLFPAAVRDQTVVNPHTAAYFREKCNWVDFIPNVLSFVGIYFAPCRVGKSIQAIRLLTSLEYPNPALIAVLKQLRHLWNAASLIIFVFVIFGVAGMQFFSGRLYHCSDPNVSGRSACNGTYTVLVPGYVVEEPLMKERRWVTEKLTYDNFGSALLSIFAIGIGSNWTTLMYAGMDSADDDKVVSRNHSAYYVVFFILAVLIVRLVALRTIIAVMTACLSRIRSTYDERTGLGSDKEQYLKAKFIVEFVSMIDVSTPKMNSLSWIAHKILTAQSPKCGHTHFYYFVRVVIFINCVFLAATTSHQPNWQQRMIFSIDIIGSVVCGLDVVLRLVAYGLKDFCRSVWNLVDFIVLVLIVVATVLPVVSFLRVIRVVKLLKGSCIERILYSICRSKLALVNISIVCSILLLVYAVVGVPLFGSVKLHDLGLTENRNFHTAIGSLLLMFQVGSMDGWEHVMLACAQNPADTGCSPGSATESCGSTAASVTYFVTYLLLVVIFLQLLMGLFLDVFTTKLQDEMTDAFLEFRRMWLETVGPGRPLIHFRDFLAIIPHMPYLLTGLKGEALTDHVGIICFLSALRLPLDSKYQIFYNDIVQGFAYKNFRMYVRRKFSTHYSEAASEFFTASQAYAAEIIQRYWRQRRRAKEAERLAMLDPVHGEKSMKKQFVEFPGVDFPNTTPQQQETNNTSVAQPLRLQLANQLPRGTLAVPGTSLFMFDFLGSICPGMQTRCTPLHPDVAKYTE